MKRGWLFVAGALALTACDYEEIEREVGYKGRARANPWLAAERFAEERGRQVRSTHSWQAPSGEESVWMMPAPALSNESFVRRTALWVRDGGHLILLIEYTDPAVNDWLEAPDRPVVQRPLERMLGEAGLRVVAEPGGPDVHVSKIRFDDRTFKVKGASLSSVSHAGEKPGGFASVPWDRGRISVLADGRLFRNRWIAEHEHAALFDALLRAGPGEGALGVLRGAGLSFWGLVWRSLWPLLVAGAVWFVLWLWRSLRRFGPLEAAEPPPVSRGYDAHLEAIGDFHWRLDHAVSLLQPLRARVLELGHQAAARAGRGEVDLPLFLAGRAGLPVERVSLALSDASCSDPEPFTRLTADLQQLHKVLQVSQRP